MNDNKPMVLDVGQCGFDHDNISRMLSEEFSADVKRAAIEYTDRIDSWVSRIALRICSI